MNKNKTIRLTESDLKRMVMESVRNVMNESYDGVISSHLESFKNFCKKHDFMRAVVSLSDIDESLGDLSKNGGTVHYNTLMDVKKCLDNFIMKTEWNTSNWHANSISKRILDNIRSILAVKVVYD